MACGLTAGRRGEQKPGISKYPRLRWARIGCLDLQNSHSTITPATYLWWFRGCYQIFPGVHPWPKVKLRKLAERQRKQRFGHGWTRMDTDAERSLPHARPGEDCFGKTL